MNKHFVLVVFSLLLVGPFGAFSQVRLNAHVGNWIALSSYKGSMTEGAYASELHIDRIDRRIQNWSLYIRLSQPMTNSEGKVFDPARVKIRINNPNPPAPTLQEIGTNDTPIPLSFSDMPIIANSMTPLPVGGYYRQWNFTYDIIIDGGAYLEKVKSWQNYNMQLTFTLVDGEGKLVAESTTLGSFQVYPQDQLPVEPTYSIQINGSARDGVLEFRTLSDYVNGVSQNYFNGLTITSTTPYALQVKALTPNLTSVNNSLPVNAVNLRITDANGTLGGEVALSDQLQTVFNGINSNNLPRSFDMRYFTKPNDERMLQAKPDSYKTTLMYTLIPQ
ncbi:hypothetical protein [Albibacterium profundi]|uniref:Uncharacterized protein n=1 Tax=Albibacterium profundi TaxID=3134906 RepID=A0ABV5CHH4_9SPHI